MQSLDYQFSLSLCTSLRLAFSFPTSAKCVFPQDWEVYKYLCIFHSVVCAVALAVFGQERRLHWQLGHINMQLRGVVMNIWRFLRINAHYGVDRFGNNRLTGPFWLCFDSQLVKTSPEVVSRCRRQNWEPVWGPKLLLDKAQIDMKWSGDNASAVLMRRRSAEQEGYSMRPEWWMMLQFPDQRKQRVRSICSVSPPLSNKRRRYVHAPQPCTHLMHAVFNFRELGDWMDMEKQWRAVIAPCKRPPFALTRSTQPLGLTHEAHFRKFWANCEKIHSSKNRKWLTAALNQSAPL